MLLSVALAALLFPVAQTSQEEGPSLEVVQHSPAVRLLLEAHGGQEAVESLTGMRFELSTFTYPEATEAEPEPAPVAGDKFGLSLRYAGEQERRARFRQETGDSELVRIAGPSISKVWIDGDERPSADLAAEAQALGGQLFLVLDLTIGVLNGQLVAEPDGRRRRNGVDYHTLRATFLESRGVQAIYLLYVHPKTGLIDRVDVFNPETLRRVMTMTLGSYHPEGGVRLPGEIVFIDRDKGPIGRWLVGPPVIAPEWPEGHFDRP